MMPSISLLLLLLLAAALLAGSAAWADAAQQHILPRPLDEIAVVEAGSSGVLLTNHTLLQGQPLYSSDGTVFLLVQPDGNLVLYQTYANALYGNTSPAAIWGAHTSGSSPAPFTLVMQQDCNLVLYSANGRLPPDAIFASNTYNQGVPPCHMLVSGSGGGGIAVLDSRNTVLFSAGAYSPAGAPHGTLPAPQTILQGVKLFSADATVFLTPQPDGNLVLYNTALVHADGQDAPAALWASSTYGASPAPFTLAIQNDCNLVLYNGNGQQPPDAIYSSGTYNRGTGCSLVISSAGGGFFQLLDSAYAVLYEQPAAFNIFLMGPLTSSPTFGPPFHAQAQIYNLGNGVVTQTPDPLTLGVVNNQALLPTENAVLAVGGVYTEVNGEPYSTEMACEIYTPASNSWAVTGALNTGRDGFALNVLHDGMVLATGGDVPNSNEIPAPPLASCEIYSPATGEWSFTGSLATARTYMQTVQLASGDVLTAGGQGSAPAAPALASAELYSFARRSWSGAGTLTTARVEHQMIRLPDGRVLVVGGEEGLQAFVYASCELWDPTTRAFNATGSMATARYLHRLALLPSGRVLVTGGVAPNPTPCVCYPCVPSNDTCFKGYELSVNSSEIYHPENGTWTPAADMPYTRYSHDMLTLPSGEVLVTGGYGNQNQPQNDTALMNSFVYDEGTNAWSQAGELVLSDTGSFFVTTTAVLFRS